MSISGLGVTFTPNGEHSVGNAEWQGLTRTTSQGTTTGSGFLASTNGIRMTVKAERDGSHESARWFMGQISGGDPMEKGQHRAGGPNKLNFAFCGDMQSADSKAKLCLGQGHSWPDNPWWVGGPGWKYDSNILVQPGFA